VAKVSRATQERIDLLLAQALGAYEELPEVVREIRGWNDAERMSYVYDWFLLEQRVEELERNSARMNPKQSRRLEDLRDAVKSHRDEAGFVKSLAAWSGRRGRLTRPPSSRKGLSPANGTDAPPNTGRRPSSRP